MRVLTFNSHQPYLHLLATTLQWDFGVVEPQLGSGRRRVWNPAIRPRPGNVQLFGDLRAALQAGPWDWVLTHNVHDLLDARDISLPKVFLVHGTLSGRMAQDGAAIDGSQYLRDLERLLDFYRCRVVYVSPLKSADYGIPGVVIPQSVDPAAYGDYRGRRRCVLRVCNHLVERGAVLAYESHRIVCDGLPSLLLGENPRLEGARTARDWDDLRDCYRECRLYLHLSVYPFEDGFNLALLEAMATGMPIATLNHPTSPIEDGVDGVTAETALELREKVARLLDDPRQAEWLGSAARRKLLERFPLKAFLEGWRSLAMKLVSGGRR